MANLKAKTAKEKKTVRISCQGAGTVSLDDLVNFQGNLKILSEESYQRLRLSIIELGFSFPIQAWKHKGKVYILDAHQRVATLKKMRDEEGYSVPALPVSWIQATNQKEAAKKLLAATSQYGEVTPDGLHSYMNKFGLDMTAMESSFQFPEIDYAQFAQAYYPQTTDVSFQAKPGSKEYEAEEFEKFAHTCPKCGFGFN